VRHSRLRTLSSFAAMLWAGLGCPALINTGWAQARPYIGFVYPAGGQQGTTFLIRLGGQGLDDVTAVRVTGAGVTAKMVDYYRRLNPQELQLLNEQTRVLRSESLSDHAKTLLMDSPMPTVMSEAGTNSPSASIDDLRVEARRLIEKIEKRTREHVPNPASAAIASLVMVEVSVAADATPGEREIRLVTLRGISNPLPIHVGQVPELTRPPMVTAVQQVLGKESQALRKQLPGAEESRVALPGTVNGQMASGEVHRYRFNARQGQRLVITTLGRQLVPFIADAVPGWFQPVLTLYDAEGREVAYDDDFRFKPDPTLFYQVPISGEYTIAVRDSLYRGREDFVYRITIGELPFVTSAYPMGRRGGTSTQPEVQGWNLAETELLLPSPEASAGTHSLAVRKQEFISNRLPFAVDTLPESSEAEPNNTVQTAQRVTLPALINGRIDRPDDWDVFRFEGKSNDTIVAEVVARRLDSPLDSVLKLTDGEGRVLAVNDDHEDLAEGINTHAADSYLFVRLPADGSYFVQIGDTARQGGKEYAYRLRLSEPRPDFDLRVVPSSLSLRSNSSGALTIYAQRRDGYVGPIKVSLKNPPPGFTAAPVSLSGTQTVARLTVKTSLVRTPEPVTLSVIGTAKNGGQEMVRDGIPAEDRMQAFLWRQLVPASELLALVFDPAHQIPLNRPLPPHPPASPATNPPVAAVNLPGTNAISSTNNTPVRPKFTKQQVAGRLKQLKLLFEEGMLTDTFYNEKVAECEAME